MFEAKKHTLKSIFFAYDYDYIRLWYEDADKKMLKAHDNTAVWTKKGGGNVRSFGGLVQLFPDKTGTMVKSTDLATLHVQTIPFKFSSRGQRLISNLYTLVGFLSF